MPNHRPVIVCATDLSEGAEAALDAAIELCLRFDVARLHVLHVREAEGRFETAREAAEAIDDEQRALEKLVAEEVARTHDAIGGANVDVVAELRFGKPYREILRFARELHADVVVVGTHGRTGFDHMLIGSVAERVVRHAPCTVVVVKPRAVTERLARSLDAMFAK